MIIIILMQFIEFNIVLRLCRPSDIIINFGLLPYAFGQIAVSSSCMRHSSRNEVNGCLIPYLVISLPFTKI